MNASGRHGTRHGTKAGDRAQPAAFAALALLALAVCAVGLYMGRAPILSPYPEDWIGWARTTLTWSGVFAVGVALLVIGIIGAIRALIPAKAPRTPATATPETALPDPAETSDVIASPAGQAEARQPRGSLSFDARRLNVAQAVAETPAPVAALHPTRATEATVAPASPLGVESLEPAIFHDNASDSFMSQAFDGSDPLSETHGLKVAAPTAEIIPIRPDIAVTPSASAAAPASADTVDMAAHDPLEAALLAETPEPAIHRDAPTDMTAVISSTLRFAPESASENLPENVSESVSGRESVAETVIALPASASDKPQAEPALAGSRAAAPAYTTEGKNRPEDDIRQATQTALSVWPDATRSIAADELSVRISHLYYDPAPESARAFHLIASGDLSGASNALQQQANMLAESGQTTRAAELWRIVGALHMGRDDARAMNAYEHVSALDASDANIHLYLARRYQMANDVARQPAVIARALYVISDPETRAELLAPYADLMLKAGNAKAGGDALEELSRLQETTAYLKPDDVGARSAYAISIARLAQAREMQGAFDQAGPLYEKAHRVFSDLSAMKPEHPGLRAMADNALRDAKRFQTA